LNATTIIKQFEKCPPIFDPGQIVMTPGAIELLANNNALVSTYVVRHVTGDWGDLDNGDAAQNNAALRSGARIFSAYNLPRGEKIWVITEGTVDEDDDPKKRELTTVLLPSEY
jgi:hypothetical protein